MLQTYFDIKEEKNKVEQNTPNLELLRTSLFWDTDISKIDWKNQSIAVIKRVFERGNEIEKKEIKRFYKSSKIEESLSCRNQKPYTVFKNKEKM